VLTAHLEDRFRETLGGASRFEGRGDSVRFAIEFSRLLAQAVPEEVSDEARLAMEASIQARCELDLEEISNSGYILRIRLVTSKLSKSILGAIKGLDRIGTTNSHSSCSLVDTFSTSLEDVRQQQVIDYINKYEILVFGKLKFKPLLFDKCKYIKVVPITDFKNSTGKVYFATKTSA